MTSPTVYEHRTQQNSDHIQLSHLRDEMFRRHLRKCLGPHVKGQPVVRCVPNKFVLIHVLRKSPIRRCRPYVRVLLVGIHILTSSAALPGVAKNSRDDFTKRMADDDKGGEYRLRGAGLAARALCP